MQDLEEMKISLEGLAHALSDNQFAVPAYQRSYAWEERHIADLFRDIADAIRRGDNEYFLGSIVVTQRTSDRPEVVDGQQRLATTSILLAAIRDWFIEQGEDRASDIETTYLLQRDLRTRETTSRLRLNNMDQEYFLKGPSKN